MDALNTVKNFFYARGNAALDIKPLKEGLYAIEDGFVKIVATALSILTRGSKDRVNDLANLPSGAHKILTGPYVYVAKIINPSAVFVDNEIKEEKDIKEEDIKEKDIKEKDIKEEDIKEEDIKEEDIKDKDIKNEDIKIDKIKDGKEITVVKTGFFTSKLTHSLLEMARDATHADKSWLSRNVFSRIEFALLIPVAAISAVADVALGAISAVFSLIPIVSWATNKVNIFAYNHLSSITGLGISAKGLRGLINPSQFQPAGL